MFLLILGRRYGVTDQTGYSPTHQEGTGQRIPRLLFELASLNDTERDGRLNDWLRSLHHEISGASFTNDADLVAQLDARLREMAAQSERLWIKLGRIVFHGTVNSRFDNRGDAEITVAARVTDGDLRRALLDAGVSKRILPPATWFLEENSERTRTPKTTGGWEKKEVLRFLTSVKKPEISRNSWV